MKNRPFNSTLPEVSWLSTIITFLLFLISFSNLIAQCTAPVASATPTSQTLCVCDTTSIVLSSNIPGTTYSWTVIQYAVTGATNGSDSIISQPLCSTGSSGGKAIYTITPYYNGCVGASINDTVIVTSSNLFIYTQTSFCQTGGNPSPVIYMPGGVFTSAPSGLVIDSITGIIDVANSITGSYTVTYTKGPCSSTKTISIIGISTSANFSYSDSVFCIDGSTQIPILGIGASAGTFSALPAGLVINPLTGAIPLYISTANTYKVSNILSSGNGCATTTITLTFYDEATFTYPSSTFCISGSNPTPTITGASGVFSSTPYGLFLDSITGTIDLTNSLTGTYTVVYTTNGTCYSTFSQSVTVTSTTPSASFNYSDSIICKVEQFILPIYDFGASGGAFSATPNGLVINQITGEINTHLSAAGSYIVTNTIAPGGSCAGSIASTTIQVLDSCGINGHLFKDNNMNCLFNSGDYVSFRDIPLKLYDSNNIFLGIWIPNNGLYNIEVPFGTYTLKIDTAGLPFAPQCIYPGIDSTVSLSNGQAWINNIDFSIDCKPGFDIGVKSILSSGLIFPGQQHQLSVLAGSLSQWYNLNCPTNGIGGQLQITVAGPVTFNGAALGALVPSIAGNVYTYSISDWASVDLYHDFKLLFITDTSAQAGDSICVSIAITPTIGDNNLNNNNYQTCYLVSNSYDPNYKQVYPINVSAGYQDWFTYTIHFQNTGNTSAMNIHLKDTLDVNLDLETFELLNYSANVETSLDNNMLTFHFPNIMLPDSTSDPEGSQGFVQYRVKPKTNLLAGTQIKNTAYIYFDYNSPIVTNTTVNEFLLTTATNGNKLHHFVRISPNPGNGKYDIKLSTEIKSEETRIEIYNIFGSLILKTKTQSYLNQIDLSQQPNGIYIVKILCSNGEQVAQRIIKQ